MTEKGSVKMSEKSDDFEDADGQFRFCRICSAVIWWIMFSVGISAFVIHSYELIDEFMKYPVVLNVEVQKGVPMTFPAVTVCSYSKYNMERLFEFCMSNVDLKVCEKMLRRHVRVSNYSPDKNGYAFDGTSGNIVIDVKPPPTTHRFCPNNNNSKTGSKSGSRSYSSSKEDIHLHDDYVDYSFEKKFELYNREIDYTAEESNLGELGQQFDEVVKDCFFMGEPCTQRNFTHSYNFQFGNCWTFKPVEKDGSPYSISRSGPQFSLKLDLYSKKNEGFNFMNVYEGFRLSVHPHYIMNFLEEDGVDVNLGYRTAISVEQLIKKWPPYPHKPYCETRSAKDFFKKDHHLCSYSTALCYRSCLQERIVKTCACLDPRLSYHKMRFDSKICNVNNLTEICCLEEALDQLSNGIECSCPTPCREEEYVTQFSQLSWLPKELYDNDLDGDRYSRVEVFFKSMHQVIHKSEPKYMLVDIFSNLGGEIGLWLGVSFITFHQVAEAFFHKVYINYVATEEYTLKQ